MDITNISSGRSRRNGYGTPGKYATTNSKYGPGRSIQRIGDFDDTEDLKLDYYHKQLGIPSSTTRTDVGQGSNGSKTIPSENSSEDIIFQGLNGQEDMKGDHIRVTRTVEIDDRHHAL